MQDVYAIMEFAKKKSQQLHLKKSKHRNVNKKK